MLVNVGYVGDIKELLSGVQCFAMQFWYWLSSATLVAMGAAATLSRACEKLADNYYEVQPRWFSVYGVPRSIMVYETPDPAQKVLAHLIKLILQHVLGYQHVAIHNLNSTEDALQLVANISWQKDYLDSFVLPGVTMSKSQEGLMNVTEKVFTFKPALIRPRINLTQRALADPRCKFFEVDWLSFRKFAPGDCDFLTYDVDDYSVSVNTKLSVKDATNAMITRSLALRDPHGLSSKSSKILEHCTTNKFCAVIHIKRGEPTDDIMTFGAFLRKHQIKVAPVHTTKDVFVNHSQFFISGYDSDRTYTFVHELLATYARRVFLTIMDFVHLFTYEDIGTKLRSTGVKSADVEEKACKYLVENKKEINRWLRKENTTVFIRYYLCDDDPYRDKIKKAMNVVEESTRKKVSYALRLRLATLSCKSGPEFAFITELNNSREDEWLYTGAMVVPKANDKAKSLAKEQETLVMLYETHSSPSELFPVFLATSDWYSLMRAATVWLTRLGYQKVTLKMKNRSDDTEQLIEHLLSQGFYLQPYTKTTTAQVVLMDADAAKQFSCEVLEGQVTPPALVVLGKWSPVSLSCSAPQYALVPDRSCPIHPILETSHSGKSKGWNREELTLLCDVSTLGGHRGFEHDCAYVLSVLLWTVSSSWPGSSQGIKTLAENGADIVLHQDLQTVLGDNWPSQVTSMVDAVLTAAHGIDSLRREHPQFIFDRHGDNVTSRLLSGILRHSHFSGVMQSLHYNDNHTLAEPLVFVTQWENGTDASLNTIMQVSRRWDAPFVLWARATTTRHDVNEKSYWSLLFYSIPVACLVALLVMFGILTKRWLLNRHELNSNTKRFAMTELSAFELQQPTRKLRNVLALWRGKYKTYVAAKTPMAGPTGASALLWEARVLAPLRHQNVVRLLGIVTEGSPPFLVLEYARYGNLSNYLEKVEITVAYRRQVCPFLLTRLAKEAAAALAYLTSRNVIHREVRASNCLVDEHHVLKLADFSMARELCGDVSEDIGMSEYRCRRRALFPVLWMAPESLKYGAFSPASDMWSYGVLLIELVTLGARPYGVCSPHAVTCHVVSGGTPLLPLDASKDMCLLTQQCWRPAANSRITAAQALEFLEQRPSALTPCTPVMPLSLPLTLPLPQALLERHSHGTVEQIKDFKAASRGTSEVAAAQLARVIDSLTPPPFLRVNRTPPSYISHRLRVDLITDEASRRRDVRRHVVESPPTSADEGPARNEGR
ncbi:Putative molluscan insulin-related peptide(s) receptor receptor beta chain [Eumeta japonica]|uniref:Molluscan insulin-related peptide(S) receptor receptor beta chain n=1 Tax=Eumeta variegata TaxID=151549 RepID=A0A4C1XGI2_EUMVA|nr:Putative molluscan insulin-related peptide(s) receptor receptor beta chain [Eumeta japonica]